MSKQVINIIPKKTMKEKLEQKLLNRLSLNNDYSIKKPSTLIENNPEFKQKLNLLISPNYKSIFNPNSIFKGEKSNISKNKLNDLSNSNALMKTTEENLISGVNEEFIVSKNSKINLTKRKSSVKSESLNNKLSAAGILKNAKPTIDEADNVNLNNFQKNGIWISKNSREKFIDILKKCNINTFKIDEEGYLSIVDIPKNEYDKELEELTKQNQLIIIDISGICYIRDEMTGEIIDYPFKDMDPMQVCEKFETTNCKIIEITINEINPISILEEILKLK